MHVLCLQHIIKNLTDSFRSQDPKGKGKLAPSLFPFYYK
jgi:hypothetical protein